MRAIRKDAKPPPVKHPTQHRSIYAPGVTACQPMYQVGIGSLALFLLLGAVGCGPPPQASQASAAVCPEVQAPVCAVHLGTKESYWNECKARRDGAIPVSPGECPIRHGYDVGSP